MGKTHVMKLAYAACQASKTRCIIFTENNYAFSTRSVKYWTISKQKKNGKIQQKWPLRIRHNKDWNDIFNENQKMGCGDYNRGKMGKANVWSHKCVYSSKRNFMSRWNLDAAVKMGNEEFDDTYLDIIAAAIDISRGVDSAARKKYLKEILQQISSGKLLYMKIVFI